MLGDIEGIFYKNKIIIALCLRFLGERRKSCFCKCDLSRENVHQRFSIGKALDTRWKCLQNALEVLENPLEVLRKVVEKLCAEPLKNPLGKFMQAILGVESKQSFILLL